MLARWPVLVSVLVTAGCAGHGASSPPAESPRAVAETKSAFAGHGIRLAYYDKEDGAPVYEGLDFTFYVAVYPTVRGAESRERSYRVGFAGQAEYLRARNVFATWHGSADRRMTAALRELR